MQKMAALSNNFGDGAPKNNVFYRGNVFLEEKNTNAPIDFLARNE